MACNVCHFNDLLIRWCLCVFGCSFCFVLSFCSFFTSLCRFYFLDWHVGFCAICMLLFFPHHRCGICAQAPQWFYLAGGQHRIFNVHFLIAFLPSKKWSEPETPFKGNFNMTCYFYFFHFFQFCSMLFVCFVFMFVFLRFCSWFICSRKSSSPFFVNACCDTVLSCQRGNSVLACSLMKFVMGFNCMSATCIIFASSYTMNPNGFHYNFQKSPHLRSPQIFKKMSV